jgi:hypothetical protein
VFSSIFRSIAAFHLSKKKESGAQANYDKALRMEPGDAQALATPREFVSNARRIYPGGRCESTTVTDAVEVLLSN